VATITAPHRTWAAGEELEQTRAALATQWETRLADLLEEAPDAEADLRTLVQQIQAALPSGMVSASDHAIAAGGDVNIGATSGGVAAGVIHGNVAPPNPTYQGPANGSCSMGKGATNAAGHYRPVNY
jgi:hypothetical protein